MLYITSDTTSQAEGLVVTVLVVLCRNKRCTVSGRIGHFANQFIDLLKCTEG